MSRQPRFLTTLAIICAGMLVVLAGACGQDDPSPSTSEGRSSETDSSADLRLGKDQLQGVKTEKVALTSFKRTIEATGTVAFDQERSTQVVAPMAGPVSRLLVDVGTRVTRGTPLAFVASPDFAAAVSALRKAAATAANASRIATLDRQLFENDAISRLEVQNAETEVANATADLESARDQLRALGVADQALSDIEEGRPIASRAGVIRSPIDGVIVEKLISPGQLLESGTTPCFTVADLSRVWVMANVFESDLPNVAAGDPAEVLTETGAPIPATVQTIDALVDPATRAVRVRLTAANPGHVLRRGLYVRVRIHPKVEGRGLLVPVSAIQRNAENLPYVFVTGPDATFARRPVGIGERIGDRQEITSGLSAGESIVVEGGIFLQRVEQQ